MKKAVIFDMDGVLSDTEWIYVDKILEMLGEEGVFIQAEEINDLFGRSMILICQELKKRYPLPKEASFYAERVHQLRDQHIAENGILPMDGAPELVKALHSRNIPIAVASSAHLEIIQANMKRFGILPYIDQIVSGHSCSQGKPAPEIYLKAAKLLGMTPADCVVVEDSATGVAAAKNAGMYCFAFAPEKAVPMDLSRADEKLTTFVGVNPDRLLMV